jgi:hypothetical protein
MPAIALPMIRAVELGAAPQMAEPTMKMRKKVNHVHYKFPLD